MGAPDQMAGSILIPTHPPPGHRKCPNLPAQGTLPAHPDGCIYAACRPDQVACALAYWLISTGRTANAGHAIRNILSPNPLHGWTRLGTMEQYGTDAYCDLRQPVPELPARTEALLAMCDVPCAPGYRRTVQSPHLRQRPPAHPQARCLNETGAQTERTPARRRRQTGRRSTARATIREPALRRQSQRQRRLRQDDANGPRRPAPPAQQEPRIPGKAASEPGRNSTRR